MIKNVFKWLIRCAGWIIIAAFAAAITIGFAIHKHKGYGTLEVYPLLLGQPYAVPQSISASAEFRINGKSYEFKLGKPICLRPGQALVEFKLRGCYLVVTNVTVVKDSLKRCSVQLLTEPCQIQVLNLPVGALINGTTVAGAYIISNAEFGKTYNLELSVPGYKNEFLAYKIGAPGENVIISNLIVNPIVGYLSVDIKPSLPDTELFIDRQKQEVGVPISLLAGAHRLTISNYAYIVYSKDFVITNESANSLTVDLQPKPAILALKVFPEVPFNLYGEDNMLIYRKNGVAKVEVGHHVLTIISEGYVPLSRKFDFEPNLEYEWNVQLDQIGLREFTSAKERFIALKNSLDVGILNRFGGKDWKMLTQVETQTNNLLSSAKNYNAAYSNLVSLVETLPDRGYVWTNEVRAANDIDFYILVEKHVEASQRLALYKKKFGAGSDFDRWFGISSQKLKLWQESIQLNPTPK